MPCNSPPIRLERRATTSTLHHLPSRQAPPKVPAVVAVAAIAAASITLHRTRAKSTSASSRATPPPQRLSLRPLAPGPTERRPRALDAGAPVSSIRWPCGPSGASSSWSARVPLPRRRISAAACGCALTQRPSVFAGAPSTLRPAMGATTLFAIPARSWRTHHAPRAREARGTRMYLLTLSARYYNLLAVGRAKSTRPWPAGCAPRQGWAGAPGPRVSGAPGSRRRGAWPRR